ncbi:DUF6011 domain-containing protein [Acinetobacter sp. ACNIH2]|uniref:DUF6011 domain-containing protein n=1 Tax=Acinetobacter sp. ACNIH2 TaxID=1758189 RepID=UPI003A52105F
MTRLCLYGYPTQFCKFCNRSLTAKASISTGFGSTKRHLCFIVYGCTINMANA